MASKAKTPQTATDSRDAVCVFGSLKLIPQLKYLHNRLASRHQALIELGMINSPADVSAFAQNLSVIFLSFSSTSYANKYATSARLPRDDRAKILAELDEYAKMQTME